MYHKNTSGYVQISTIIVFLLSNTGTTNNFQQRGIIPRAISQLFTEIKQKHEYNISIQVSYLEIYKEQMFDLLSTMYDGEKTSGLSIAEDKNGATYVKGLSYLTAKTEEEALNYLFEVFFFYLGK